MQSNQEQNLSFSNDYIDARVVTSASNFRIAEESILVNLGSDSAEIEGAVPTYLPPWASLRTCDAAIARSGRIALLRIKHQVNIGRLLLDPTWRLFADTLPDPSPGFPRDTPLWLSTQDSVGILELDPLCFTGQRHVPEDLGRYEIKLNLWFATSNTDCSIHNHSETSFLEVHTQVYGTGRMQKFRSRDASTMYEQVLLAPGNTHHPYPMVDQGSVLYPWHRYYADTDCIWMAIELHPCR